MYYSEFTKAAAAEAIREILDNMTPCLAIDSIIRFLNDIDTYEEITALFD